jgi:hypothetical protein
VRFHFQTSRTRPGRAESGGNGDTSLFIGFSVDIGNGNKKVRLSISPERTVERIGIVVLGTQ